MRHDPAGAAIVITLRSLKMSGMAQAVCQAPSWRENMGIIPN